MIKRERGKDNNLLTNYKNLTNYLKITKIIEEIYINSLKALT